MDPHLSGQALYGDDFAPDQIEQWFKDEADAYFEMSGSETQEAEHYGYVELNRQTLFRHLPPGRYFRHALGFGSGRGAELAPLAPRIGHLTILESSESYGRDFRLTMSGKTVLARSNGDIALSDGSVDLITSLGVLHHIPNVTHVLREFARILEPGGILLLREPIVSMADNRRGLTPHERGIPLEYLRRRLDEVGLSIESQTLAGCPLLTRLCRFFGYSEPRYNSPSLTWLDQQLCRVLRPNLRYHATTNLQKVRPTSVAIVARRSL